MALKWRPRNDENFTIDELGRIVLSFLIHVAPCSSVIILCEFS